MAQGESSPLAFVLMPFAQEFQRVYDSLIQPSLTSEGYDVKRADTTFDQMNIMRTVVENIANAELVIAEVTTVNANVFYELGIAHALGKPVVMVAQGLDEIPFDLRSYRTILYSTEFDEVDSFKEALREVARQRRDNTISFGNPVTDFAPEQVSAGPDVSPPRGKAASNEESEDEEPEDDLGVYDFVHTAETSLERVTTTSEEITETVNNFGANLVARGAEIESVSSSAPGSSARMMHILRGMASDMKEFSDKVSVELPEFHTAWEGFEDSFTNLLSRVRIETKEDREQAVALKSSMDDFREVMTGALAGVEQARGVFEPMKGMSKDLNVAVRRVEKTIERVAEEFSIGESVIIRTTNLLDQKILGG